MTCWGTRDDINRWNGINWKLWVQVYDTITDAMYASLSRVEAASGIPQTRQLSKWQHLLAGVSHGTKATCNCPLLTSLAFHVPSSSVCCENAQCLQLRQNARQELPKSYFCFIVTVIPG